MQTIPHKTLDKIKKHGYKLTYLYGCKTKCQIKKDGGYFIDGNPKTFNSPTAALNWIRGNR